VLHPQLPALSPRRLLGVRWRWLLLVAALMGGEWAWLSSGQTAPARDRAAVRAPKVPTPVAGLALPRHRGAGTVATRWMAIVGAGDEGVYLRRGPRPAPAVAVWPEGTELAVVDPRRAPDQAAPTAWLRVRDPAGQVGYMAAEYLAPALPPRRVYVGHTGGLGVYLRRTPRRAVHIRAWVEGTPLVAFGTETDAAGEQWTYVRDPAGNLGWVPAQYLVPEHGSNGQGVRG
jgi:hypothetical protein